MSSPTGPPPTPDRPRPVRYCGRDFTAADLDTIRQLIAAFPQASRAELSRQVATRLGWRGPGGAPKAMSCRVAMLRMEADGRLRLPAPRGRRPHPRPYTPGTPATDPGWLHVGTTQGRGKLDRDHTARLPPKDIYLYPLTEDCRTRLTS